MSLTLSDALSHYRWLTEANHRFWGYLQVVAAGVTAFAWSSQGPVEGQTFLLVAVAFAIFALLNWRLVVVSQADAIAVAQCLKSFASDPTAAVPGELKSIVERIEPDSTIAVGLWHAGVSTATLLAIWWRYYSLARGHGT